MTRFHIITNAHLDPVWLWDWREGLNEGIATCRAVLDLMEEFPELKFTRGEASVYEHIERHAPETFARIREKIAEGRWEVAGGNYVQPDTNLPATEVLARQFRRGLGYFRRALGVRPVAAWAADSFGHSAGCPAIYAAAGMKYFAFWRPFASELALPGPAFWWEAAGGERVLSWRIQVGWYGSTRAEIPGRLDAYRKESAQWGIENVMVPLGLGNHGGGPSRAQIEAVLRWRGQNRDAEVVFSTLHGFFGALSAEAARLPVFRGELNFTLRGCYASAASVKFAYRRAENALLQAERTVSAVGALREAENIGAAPPAPDLGEAWDAVLFNTFHDVLPGTAIERALAGQRAWIGLARHHAARAENDALNALAARVDTSVPRATGDRPAVAPVLLWNPNPHPFDGPVEFEAPLDYRPLDAFKNKPDAVPLAVRDGAGRALPFQCVAVENNFALETPWRKRFVTRVKIPPCGWHVLTAGLADAPVKTPRVKTDLRAGAGRIANRVWEIRAAAGAGRVVISRKGKQARRLGLRVLTVDDPWGSWGGHNGEPEANHVNHVKDAWKIEAVETLERGPERASLWIRLTGAGGASWIELTLRLWRDDDAVVVKTRAFWAEKSARLKLEFSGIGGAAEFEAPGGSVRREPCGDVPGGRWVRFGGVRDAGVFASDALYCFDTTATTFGATIARSAPYASIDGARPGVERWRPCMDLGEHLFQFALGADTADADALARRLESPPVALLTAAHEGALPRTGGVLRAGPGLRLLAFARAADGGWMLRVQGAARRAADATVELLGGRIALGRLAPGRIRTVILRRAADGGGRGAGAWTCAVVNCAEETLAITPAPAAPEGNKS